jgi:hypothetical protein
MLGLHLKMYNVPQSRKLHFILIYVLFFLENYLCLILIVLQFIGLTISVHMYTYNLRTCCVFEKFTFLAQFKEFLTLA